MPTGDFGKQVKLGKQIFLHTKEYAGKYVGNSLNCVNCHLDAGRKANARASPARSRKPERNTMTRRPRCMGIPSTGMCSAGNSRPL
jgi:hypothetical protein